MRKVMMISCAAVFGCNPGTNTGQDREVQEEDPDFSGTQTAGALDTGAGPDWASQDVIPGEYEVTIDSVSEACDSYVAVGGTYTTNAWWDSDGAQVLLFGMAPIVSNGSTFTATGEGHRIVGDACEVTDTLDVTGTLVQGSNSFTASVSEVRSAAGTCTSQDLASVCDNAYTATFVYIEPTETTAPPALVPGDYTMTVQQVMQACDDYVAVDSQLLRSILLDPDSGDLVLLGFAPLVIQGDTFAATGAVHRTVGAECDVTDTVTFTGYLNGSDTSFDATVLEQRSSSGICTAEDLAQVCDNEYEASFDFLPQAINP